MARPTPHFNPDHWAATKTKRQEVRDNQGGENSVPALRGRVENIEQAIGLKPAN